MKNFKEWLESELETRDWSMADLARYAGVARGSVANVLRGDRNPGKDFCDGVAKAFKIAPEIVYRRAGILPPEPKQNEKRQELIHLYEMMSEDNQDDQLAYARMKLQMQEREDKNKKNGKGNRPSNDL